MTIAHNLIGVIRAHCKASPHIYWILKLEIDLYTSENT